MYQSFLYRNSSSTPSINGNASSGRAFGLHGTLTPPRIAARRPPLLLPLQRSACDWTQVSLCFLPVIALQYGCAVLPELRYRSKACPGTCSFGLSELPDSRRKVNDALNYSVFKIQARRKQRSRRLRIGCPFLTCIGEEIRKTRSLINQIF